MGVDIVPAVFDRDQSTGKRFNASNNLLQQDWGNISVDTIRLVKGMKAPLKPSSTPNCRKSDRVLRSETEHRWPKISPIETARYIHSVSHNTIK